MSCAYLTRHALRTSPLQAARPSPTGVHALQASRRLLVVLQLTDLVAGTEGHYRAGAAAPQCKQPRRHIWRRAQRMADNAALVDQMVTEGWLTNQRCIEVMKRVDRKHYVHPTTPGSEVYEDHPLPLGPAETISAPHMHARALELLSEKLVPGARVLDVGSGSGYLTACFGLLVQPAGFAVGIERNEGLTEMSKTNLQKSVPELMEGKTAIVIRSGNILGSLQSDGTQFDAIHVGAAAATLPKQVCDLLAPGGLMMVPVGPRGGAQVLSLVKKIIGDDGEERLDVSKCGQVQYVPLTAPDMSAV